MDVNTAILLTLVNTLACLAFPWLLSVILAPKTQRIKIQTTTLHQAKSQLTTFPYCLSFSLTGSKFCKFRPNFCDKCSPN